MVAVTLAIGWRLAIYLVAGVLAGISNGIAGGGTFITFPTLLATGIPALQANVTSTVGVVPGSVGGVRLFRHQLRPHRALLRSLIVPCLVGTLVGCALLLLGAPTTFENVVPWLIGGATVVFALSPAITARLVHVDQAHPARRWTLFIGIFLIAIYGGYFGAGLGILLLALMAVTLPLQIHELQGLRNLLTMIINSIAAVVFVLRGHLVWGAVIMLLIGTLVGGWLGTLLIRRLSPSWVRLLVVGTGLVTTVHLALRK